MKTACLGAHTSIFSNRFCSICLLFCVVFVDSFGFNSGRIANNFDDFVLLFIGETIDIIQTNIQNRTFGRHV